MPNELEHTLADLSAALGLAAASAQASANDWDGGEDGAEYHHGKAAGLRQAQRLVLALMRDSAIESRHELTAQISAEE